jgi:alpha-glucosidase (family GH31 glycosyl hydrolase)
MTPCNLFYSSKSVMEMLEKGKYVINTEQNMNVDKTFLKFSIKDIMMFTDVMEIISKDMEKFNEETGKFTDINLITRRTETRPKEKE